MIGLILGLE